MVNPTFNIGGIASGLDTSGIIEQLLQLERQPIVRYQNRQQELRRVDDAWGSVVSRLSGVRSALDEVTGPSSLRGLMSITSSDESVATATVGQGASPTELGFSVERLASRHRVTMSESHASANDLVGAGTITLTDHTGATLGTIATTDTTTLKGLADQIDALGVGIDASVLKVDDGDVRLVLTSTTTGDDSRFGLTTDVAGLGTATVAAEGLDAHLKVGGIDVYRSTNTVDDLVEGVTLNLRKAAPGTEVTVGVARDDEAAAEKVTALVTALNSVIDRLDALTSYDPETGESGLLQGDPAARDLAFDLRAALTGAVTGQSFSSVADIGISLTRDGKVELDEAKLEEALATDASAVFGLFSETLSGDAGVELTFVGSDATDRDLAMTVSQAASVASATGASYTPPTGSPKTFTITMSDGSNVSVTIDENMSAADAVARINSALKTAGSTNLEASLVDDGSQYGALQLATVGYGSRQTFTVSGSGDSLDGTHVGQDVVVDFGTGDVTGSGQSVTHEGLTLRLSGGTGTYEASFSRGAGGMLDDALSLLEGTTGRIQVARDAIDGSIRDFDAQIEQFERRVEIRESALRRKFSSLESVMGQLQSQGAWLASQLGSMQG